MNTIQVLRAFTLTAAGIASLSYAHAQTVGVPEAGAEAGAGNEVDRAAVNVNEPPISDDPQVWAAWGEALIQALPAEIADEEQEIWLSPQAEAAYWMVAVWADLGNRTKTVEMIGMSQASEDAFYDLSEYAYAYYKIGNRTLSQAAADNDEDLFTQAYAIGEIGLAQVMSGEEALGTKGMVWAAKRLAEVVEIDEDYDAQDAAGTISSWVGWMSHEGKLEPATQLLSLIPPGTSHVNALLEVALWKHVGGDAAAAEALYTQAIAEYRAVVEPDIAKAIKLLEQLAALSEKEADAFAEKHGYEDAVDMKWELEWRQESEAWTDAMFAGYLAQAGRLKDARSWLTKLEGTEFEPSALVSVASAFSRRGDDPQTQQWLNRAMEAHAKLPVDDRFYYGFDLGLAAGRDGYHDKMAAWLATTDDPMIQAPIAIGMADGLRIRKDRAERKP